MEHPVSLARDADMIMAARSPSLNSVDALSSSPESATATAAASTRRLKANEADMVYGDASAVLAKMIEAARGLGSKAA